MLGVIVSQSGSSFLQQYGELVMEGIRLAVDAHNRSGGVPVELVALDDGGDPAQAAALVTALEGRGVVGIIGPLRPEAVAIAAGARSDTLLPLVSPTAPDVPRYGNVYSLNSGDTRGAELLAEYAVASGLLNVALLYPNTSDFRRQAWAFREVVVREGGRIVAEVPFDSGAVSFAEPLRQIAEVRPEVLFVPGTERDIRQIAPQITYYGLSGAGVQILGGEAWTSDGVRHQVAGRYLEGVIAATPLFKPSPEFAWQDFVSLYESTYRRSLENPLPALGYDAASLLLSAVEDGGDDVEDVARYLAELQEVRGATGLFSVRSGEIVRRPVLVRIEKGELVPVVSGTNIR